MKTFIQRISRTVIVATILTSCITSHAQFTSTWDGGGSDGLWNTDANWDTDLTPGPLTNAVIPTGIAVNYNAPMTATSFDTLTLYNSTLNINAGSFVVAGALDGTVSVFGTGASTPSGGLFINNGGAVNLTGGGLTLDSNTVAVVSPGGSLTVQGQIRLGNSGGNSPSFGNLTNNGGVIRASSTFINPGNAAGSQTGPASRFVINGGTNDLGDVTIQRSPAASQGFGAQPLGREGLIISNGLARTTSLDVGGPAGNSWLTMFIGDGTLTNTGTFTVRAGTAGRASRFLQTGGVVESLGGNVHLRGHTANNSLVLYSVLGGTNVVQGFVFGDLGDVAGTVRLTNAAKIYVGSGGFTADGTLSASGTNIVLGSGGVFGAQADWTGTLPMILNGGSFDAAALDGTAHNITLSGELSGPGALTKTGNGDLTLEAANSFSGVTSVNAGRLLLGASASIPNASRIIIASNTVLDVSAVSGGFVLNDSRTIAGFGEVAGNVTLASGSIVDPGTSAGTLTFGNDLTANGGAVFRFELSANPSGPDNDFVIVGGSLNVTGANDIQVSGGPSVGNVYRLFQYGTAFNGDTSSFSLVGVSGVISNNATTKTIYLVVQSAGRAPTSVVWSGLTSDLNGNLWDTEATTNWVFEAGGAPTHFVSGDAARFVTSGSGIQTNVMLADTVSPGAVTVDSTAHYTFIGNGRISGEGRLTKTNSGTLTLLTTNNYTGPTTIGGGVLEANILADSAVNSSIGAASTDPTNLVFSGGTLRYLGDSVSTDRGATLNVEGGTIDVTNDAAALTVGGTIAGGGGLTKTGAGTLTLPTANSYAGITTVSNGTLTLNVPGAAGANSITLAGGTLFLAGPSDVNFLNDVNVGTTSGLGMGASNNRLNGDISGGATLNVSIETAASAVFTLNGNLTNYTGTFNLGNSVGTFRFNSGGGNTTFGCPNATIDLGAASATLQARNAGTMSVGGLQGGAGTIVRGQGSGSGTLIWQIGADSNNPNTTFDGTIVDNSATAVAGINKVGSGTLTLRGANTYTGPTFVSSGTLALSGAGSIAGSTNIQVAAGATLALSPGVPLFSTGTLGGGGSIQGDLQVYGTLEPGASIGTLTVSGDAGLYNTAIMEISSPNNSDKLSAATITVGGTIVVTNIGGNLHMGDQFDLFDGVLTDFAPIVVTPAGYGFDTSQLTVSGIITVTSAPTPPQIDTVKLVSGTGMIISGSGGSVSGMYNVLATTNVTDPIGMWNAISTDNMFDGSGNFSFTNAIDPNLPRQFLLIQQQ